MRISPKLTAMLEALPRNHGSRIFPRQDQQIDDHQNIFIQQRKRTSNKLKNPRLLRITFHTLQHFKGNHGISSNKRHLTCDVNPGTQEHQGYPLVRAACRKTLQRSTRPRFQSCQDRKGRMGLAEAGLDYVCDLDGTKIFRKSKYQPLDKPSCFCL
jgi:hypothetical protein